MLCGLTQMPTCNLRGKGGFWLQNMINFPLQLPPALSGVKGICSPFAPFHLNLWWTGLGPGRSQGSPLHTHCCCWNGFSKSICAGGSPGDSVLEPELGTLRQEVKGDWLLLLCHFLDALQTLIVFFCVYEFHSSFGNSKCWTLWGLL